LVIKQQLVVLLSLVLGLGAYCKLSLFFFLLLEYFFFSHFGSSSEVFFSISPMEFIVELFISGWAFTFLEIV
jgi:hypothetical protein